jgi:hypothetical protein
MSLSFLLLDERFWVKLSLICEMESIAEGKSPCHEKQSGSKFRLFPWAIFLGLLVGIAGIWSSNKEVLGLFHDDGIYAAVAKSLSDGSGYRIISLPTVPDQTKYPFLYSYILSWLWSLDPKFPDNIGLLKSANAVFLAVIFVLSYLFYWHRAAGAESEGLLFAALVCINPAVFSFTDFTVSDILLLLLSLFALVIFDASKQWTSRPSSVTLLAVAVALGCLTRSAAIPLAVAGAVHFAWSKRYRDLLHYVCVVLAVIIPWWLWVRTHSNQAVSSLLDYYVSYGSEPPAFVIMWSDPFGAVEIVSGNLRYIMETLDLIFQSKIIPGLLLPVGLVLLLGVWRSFNDQSVFFRSYVLLYLLLVVAWPFHPGRYLIPLVPVIYFFLFCGVETAQVLLNNFMTSKARRKTLCHFVRVTFALVVVLQVGWMLNYFLNKDVTTTRVWFGKRLPTSWQGFSETFEWIRSNTDESTILATPYDPMYYLYTGRRSIQPSFHNPSTYFYPYGEAVPFIGSPEEIKAELKSLDVRFFVTHQLSDPTEQTAHSKLWSGLSRSYRNPPELLFVSSDFQHRIYALPQE